MNFVALKRLWSRFNENSMAFMLRKRIVICLVKVCGKMYLGFKINIFKIMTFTQYLFVIFCGLFRR